MLTWVWGLIPRRQLLPYEIFHPSAQAVSSVMVYGSPREDTQNPSVSATLTSRSETLLFASMMALCPTNTFSSCAIDTDVSPASHDGSS